MTEDEISFTKLSKSIDSLAESLKYLVKEQDEIKKTLIVVSEAMTEQKLHRTQFEAFQERDSDSKKRIYARLDSQENDIKELRKENQNIQNELNQSCELKTKEFNNGLEKVKDDLTDDIDEKNDKAVNQMRWAIGIIITVFLVFGSNLNDDIGSYQKENSNKFDNYQKESVKRFDKINMKMDTINNTMLKYLINKSDKAHK